MVDDQFLSKPYLPTPSCVALRVQTLTHGATWPGTLLDLRKQDMKTALPLDLEAYKLRVHCVWEVQED